MTIQAKCEELYDLFNRDEQQPERGYVPTVLVIKHPELNKVSDAVYGAVSDYPWDVIHTALSRLSDYEDQYLDDGTAVDETEADPYYHQLLDWLKESNHSEWVSEVMEERHYKEIFNAITDAQARWKRAITQAVLDAVREIVGVPVPEEEAE